jgi:hypothetical protein
MATKLSIGRARDAWPYLVARASAKGEPFTYKQLSEKMELHWRAAQWFLEVIQIYCDKNGLPPLQALVVNRGTKLPGAGYSHAGQTAKAFRADLQKIYAHPWPAQAPF